jgi:two-component system, NarL family, response regulator NreC
MGERHGDDGAVMTVVLADDHVVVRSACECCSRLRMGCRWLPRRATSAGRCARSVPTGRTCSCSILEASPDTAIVILTMQGEPGLARAALRAGARAFVLKDEAGAELVAAVRAAATGSRYVNPQLGARIAAEPDGRAEPPDHLNDRELEVLKLVAVGHTSMEIGRQLDLSVRTVEDHRSRILRKTRRSSRAELVAYAREYGIVD